MLTLHLTMAEDRGYVDGRVAAQEGYRCVYETPIEIVPRHLSKRAQEQVRAAYGMAFAEAWQIEYDRQLEQALKAYKADPPVPDLHRFLTEQANLTLNKPFEHIEPVAIPTFMKAQAMLTQAKREAAFKDISSVHPDWPRAEVLLAVEMMPTFSGYAYGDPASAERTEAQAKHDARMKKYLEWVLTAGTELPSVRRANQQRATG